MIHSELGLFLKLSHQNHPLLSTFIWFLQHQFQQKVTLCLTIQYVFLALQPAWNETDCGASRKSFWLKVKGGTDYSGSARWQQGSGDRGTKKSCSSGTSSDKNSGMDNGIGVNGSTSGDGSDTGEGAIPE